MATLELRDVRKSFGKVEVIPGLDLQVEDGEFLVLVGPSGCGKSTLLRMIAGLEEISSGDLAISGKRMNEVSARERGIAMVFQSYALYPHMTTEENMGFALKLRGVGAEDRRARIRPAAETLGLGAHLFRLPRALSGGQRQRVAMGRCIVREPDVFLFDEPLSNLDAKLRVRMRAELKEQHQRLGTTTVYVTHDQIEAMTLADRIALLRDGRIEQIGTPLELYDKPRNRFVASFLGSPSMNFFDVTSADAADQGRLGDGQRVVLPFALPDRPVTLGLRPEAFTINPEGSTPMLTAEVIVVEPTGADTELFLRVGDEKFTISVRDRVFATPGTRLGLSYDPGAAHLFDRDTGVRLEPLAP